jgi:hypothetical protein
MVSAAFSPVLLTYWLASLPTADRFCGKGMTGGRLCSFTGFHRLIHGFTLTLLWLCYEFTTSIPLLKEVVRVNE